MTSKAALGRLALSAKLAVRRAPSPARVAQHVDVPAERGLHRRRLDLVVVLLAGLVGALDLETGETADREVEQ